MKPRTYWRVIYEGRSCVFETEDAAKAEVEFIRSEDPDGKPYLDEFEMTKMAFDALKEFDGW